DMAREIAAHPTSGPHGGRGSMTRQLSTFGLALLLCVACTSAQAAPFAYIADDGASNVSVIDTQTNTIIATITGVGTVPEGVAVTAAGTRVYVTDSVTSGSVAVIDTATNTVMATIPVGAEPFGVAVTPDGTRAYVGNFADGTVSVIDATANTVITTIVLPCASGVAINPAGTRVYVANGSTV